MRPGERRLLEWGRAIVGAVIILVPCAGWLYTLDHRVEVIEIQLAALEKERSLIKLLDEIERRLEGNSWESEVREALRQILQSRDFQRYYQEEMR